MSLPIEYKGQSETDPKSDLGLHHEDAKVRTKILSDAKAYVDLKSGRKGRKAFSKWVDTCEAHAGDWNENPFCRLEQDRRSQTQALRAPPLLRDERLTLARALKDGNFTAATSANPSTLNAAIKTLDGTGDLETVAATLAKSSTCYSTALNYLTAYKLEERFPTDAAVELARSIYRRGSECSSAGDYHGALASFRYGLIQIWKKQYSEIPALMTKVEASIEASGFHARAKFWRHFAANQTGDANAKLAAREALLKDHPLTFQNLAIVGDDPAAVAKIMRPAPAFIAYRSLVRSDLNPFIRGTEALIEIGSTQIAADLVDRNVSDVATMEPEVRLYIASLMNRIGYALPKFKILSNLFQNNPAFVTQQTMHLFFPTWYADIIKKADRHVDPLLILSLIRQESAFNKQARSQVGARGLMQVMPATARMVASVRKTKLFDPETNIDVGTKYLSQRLRQYDGDVELTLAAYNAGFSRVDEWKRRYPTDNRMLFLDFIPFRETRDYVSSILRNYYWYVKLYDDESPLSNESGPRVKTTDIKVQAIMGANAGSAAVPVATTSGDTAAQAQSAATEAPAAPAN